MNSRRPVADAPARALQLLGLSSFAVAAPLFDLIARHPDFLVAHGAQPADVLAFALALAVLVPLALIASAQAVSWLSAGLGFGLHCFLVGALVAAAALPPLGRAGLPGWLPAVAGLVIGALASVGFARLVALRRFTSWLWPAALLFPALFLLLSPVQSLAWRSTPSAAAARSVKVPDPLPVVLIVLDELPVTSLMNRAQGIDAIRYPNFARLARDAIWFRNTASVAHDTTRAVPAIVTGKLPGKTLPATAASHPHSLFTLLGASHRMRVFEPLTALCPHDLCPATGGAEEDSGLEDPGLHATGRARRFASLMRDTEIAYLHLLVPPDKRALLPPIRASWSGFAETRADTAEAGPTRTANKLTLFARFLESFEENEAPTLHFLHLMLPHIPWRYLPSGHEYGPLREGTYPHGVVNDVWSEDEWESLQGMQRHLLQVGFVDRLLGQLLDRLEETRLYERAVLILVADHGASFQPGLARRIPVQENLADILAVPLFVKPPGRGGGRIDDRLVFTVDVLPTIAELLAIDSLPFEVDGHSALPGERMDRRSIRVAGQRLGPAALAKRRKSLERMLAAFGEGDDARLYHFGPHAELVGRELSSGPNQWVSSSRESRWGEIEVALDDAGHYDDVQPDTGYVPAQISGSLRAQTPSLHPVPLAIAINGTIHATTRSYETRGKTHFSAMVPLSAYRRGRNDVEVFVINALAGRPEPELIALRDVSVGGWAIRPVTLAGVRDEELVSPRGDTVPLEAGGPTGSFTTQQTLHDVQYLGWAIDRVHPGDPHSILLFADGRFVDATATRGASATGRGESLSLAKTHFRIRLPGALQEPGRTSTVRIFAVGRDRATELFQAATAPRYSLVNSAEDGLAIRVDDGQSIPVLDGSLRGMARRRQAETDVSLVGWAADLEHRELPDLVLAFLGDTYLGRARLGRDRSDVARTLGVPELPDIGFRFELPEEAAAEASSARLRLFAVSRRKIACEIPIAAR